MFHFSCNRRPISVNKSNSWVGYLKTHLAEEASCSLCEFMWPSGCHGDSRMTQSGVIQDCCAFMDTIFMNPSCLNVIYWKYICIWVTVVWLIFCITDRCKDWGEHIFPTGHTQSIEVKNNLEWFWITTFCMHWQNHQNQGQISFCKSVENLLTVSFECVLNETHSMMYFLLIFCLFGWMWLGHGCCLLWRLHDILFKMLYWEHW